MDNEEQLPLRDVRRIRELAEARPDEWSVDAVARLRAERDTLRAAAVPDDELHRSIAEAAELRVALAEASGRERQARPTREAFVQLVAVLLRDYMLAGDISRAIDEHLAPQISLTAVGAARHALAAAIVDDAIARVAE